MAQPSPCSGICLVSDQQICIGCYRSLDEIARWAAASNQEQREILDRIAGRIAEAAGAGAAVVADAASPSDAAG